MGVKLADIAKETGLSINTVSRALNSRDGVRDETRARVQQVAARLGYLPNNAARSLRTKRTNTIGVILEDNSNPYCSKLLKTIEEAAIPANYNVIMCNTNEEEVRELRAVELLLEKLVDGIIIHPLQQSNRVLTRLLQAGVPFVTVGRRFPDHQTNYVVCNNYEGTKMAVRHLITNRGCKNILFFCLPQRSSSAIDRLRAYKDELQSHGLVFRESLVRYIKINIESGYLAMKEVLESGLRFDGVFCGCDIIAIGVLNALLEQGLRVPDDVPIVGYDDIDFSAYLAVPLTTVHQPIQKIGANAVDILLELINSKNKTLEKKEIVLNPELIIRSSA